MIKNYADLKALVDADIIHMQSLSKNAALAVSLLPVITATHSDDGLQVSSTVEDFYEHTLHAALQAMQDTMVAGYERELQGRKEIARHDQSTLEIEYDITESEKQALYRWPVMGHMLTEIATHITERLRFDVISVLSGPDRGAFPVEQVAEHLNKVQFSYSNILAQQITNVYLCGAQAARELIRESFSAGQG